MKSKLVISKHWHEPEIELKFDADGFEINLTLEDFCRALVAEAPHPWSTFTRNKLENDIISAVDTVLTKAKEVSIHLP